MSKVVEGRKLTKAYGGVLAVNQVSFSIEAGKIYGLLGRNGAGKTTLMQLITAQLFPSSGEVLVFGEHPYENSRVLSQICFIKDSQKYPNSYRLLDLLDQATFFFPHWDREYALALTEEFRLPLKRRMKALSRGMLCAAGIIVGLASRAPLTIFKELLARSPLGGLVSATVMSDGNLKDRQQAEALGLELAPVSLQQLIVHLTGEPPKRKAVEVR